MTHHRTQVFCANCGGGNPPEAVRCMWCGASMQAQPLQGPSKRSNVSGCLVPIAVLLLALITWSIFGSSAADPTSGYGSSNQSGAPAPRTPGYMLASLDAGYSLEASDSRISAYSSALSRLSADYGATDSHIADVMVTAQGDLQKNYGKHYSLIQLMQGAEMLAPAASQANQSIETVMAMSVVSLGVGK